LSISVDGEHYSISELSGLKHLQRSEKHLLLYGSSVLENILLLDLPFTSRKILMIFICPRVPTLNGTAIDPSHYKTTLNTPLIPILGNLRLR